MISEFLWAVIRYVGPVFIALSVLTITIAYFYYTWNFGFWEKQGVPTLKPVPFLGSRPWNYKEVPQLKDIEYRQKFGKVWGEYRGRDPFLYVCDPELVKEIMVKNFECWVDRRFFDFGEVFENSLDMLKGEQWKTVRSMMTPGLSSGKIKHGNQIFVEKSKSLVSVMKKDAGETGKAMNVNKYFGFYGLDVIAAYGFGLDINTQEDNAHPFAVHAQKVMDPGDWGSPFSMTLEIVPFLTKYINLFELESGKYFARAARNIVDKRKEDPVTRDDFLGLLVKAINEIPNNKDYQRLKIDRRLLENQCQLFLLAGFDTVRTTMTGLAHMMALHPDKQQRVIEEVEKALQTTDGVIDHETIGKLPYMEACINEALRLFPPLIRNERVCTKDTELNGIKIPKGVCIMMPTWALARDPDNFENPDDFVPERFEKENIAHDQYAWNPFGHGPRACIGMRFAYEKMKFALCHFYRELEFYKAPETVELKDLQFCVGSIFLISYMNSVVGVRPRKQKT